MIPQRLLSAGQGVESSEDSQPENSNDAHDVSEKDTATSQRWAPAEEDGSADRASRQAAPWEDSEFGACFGKERRTLRLDRVWRKP